VNPFFFGESRRPLFGVHHPPAGPAAPLAAVVCNPFGQEALRAHRSLRELATRLAQGGLHVLRFDYHGTGDSAGEGEEARIDEWLADVSLAADELRETSGRDRLCLVGLRLGGALAALAASRRSDVAALVLWDPVVRGNDYVAELRKQHEDWMADHVHGYVPGGAATEVLGFPLPTSLAEGVAALDLAALDRPPAPATLVVSSSAREPDLPSWAHDGENGVRVLRFPPSPVWLHEEGLGLSLVPRPLVDGVASWVRENGR
jgi:alpha-beta hydrolase superfamily lysophospholipase